MAQKKTRIIILFILIFSIAAALVAAAQFGFFAAPLAIVGVNATTAIGTSPLTASQSAGINSYDVLSMSNIGISGLHTNGFNGDYYLATISLDNAGMNLIGVAPAASLTTLQNISASGVDGFIIKANKNSITYPVDTNEFATVYAYNLSTYGGPITYTNCNGDTQTTTGAEPMSSECLLSNNANAYASYENACKAASGSNIPVIVSEGSGSKIYVPIGIFPFFTNYYFPSGTEFECYQLQKFPYAELYEFGSPYYQENVSVQVNNFTVSVNQAKQVASATWPNGTIAVEARLLDPKTTFSAIPTPSAIGTIVYYLSNATRVDSSLSQYAGSSLLLNYVPISAISADSNQAQDLFNTLASNGNLTIQQLVSDVALLNGYSTSSLLNQTTSPYSSDYSGAHDNHLANYSLVLNDMEGTYLIPQVQLITDFNVLGMTFASASCKIVSASPTSFNPTGYGSLSVTVENSGGVPGSCGTYLTTASGLYTTTSEQYSGTLSPGGTATEVFTLGYSNYLNTSLSLTAEVHSCASATGSQCANESVPITVNANCAPNSTVQNSNTCKPILPPPTATTTIQPTINTTTTIAPCQGSACTPSATPPPAAPSTPWGAIIVIILVIAIAGILAGFLHTRKELANTLLNKAKKR